MSVIEGLKDRRPSRQDCIMKAAPNAILDEGDSPCLSKRLYLYGRCECINLIQGELGTKLLFSGRDAYLDTY